MDGIPDNSKPWLAVIFDESFERVSGFALNQSSMDDVSAVVAAATCLCYIAASGTEDPEATLQEIRSQAKNFLTEWEKGRRPIKQTQPQERRLGVGAVKSSTGYDCYVFGCQDWEKDGSIQRLYLLAAPFVTALVSLAFAQDQFEGKGKEGAIDMVVDDSKSQITGLVHYHELN